MRSARSLKVLLVAMAILIVGGCSLVVEFDRSLLLDGGVDGGADGSVDTGDEVDASADAGSDAD